MSDVDKDIRNGFTGADDAGEYDLGKEETFGQMLAESFRGKMRWMVVLVWFYGLAFTAVAVFAAIQFFRVDATRDLILYATVFLTGVLFIALIKIWYWMLMNRNSVKREVKRLELQIARLTEALDRE